MRHLVSILFAVSVLLLGCSSEHPVGLARQATTSTVTLYSYSGDANALSSLPETSTLWTAPAAASLRDIIFQNGSVPLAEGSDDAWANVEVCWGTSPSGYGCEWLPTVPTDECGIGAVAANATYNLSSMDPGCTGIGLDDGMGGVGYPPIAAGDQFYVDEYKGGDGQKLGPWTVSIVVSY